MLKRILAALLASAMALSLVACANTDDKGSSDDKDSSSDSSSKDEGEDEDGKGSKEITMETMKEDLDGTNLTWYIHYDWASDFEWGDDITSKWFVDNLGVNVDVISSGGAAEQKLTTMIASNELPDLITLERGPDTNQLIDAGALVTLNDYAEAYPNLKYWATDVVINALKDENGDLYGVPNWYTNEEWPLGTQAFVANRKYYDEAGQPALDTMDQLYDYLLDLKSAHPDIIPLTLGTDLTGLEVFTACFDENLPQGFTVNGFYADGDKLKFVYENEKYIEALLTLNSMYRDGLISSDNMSMQKEQYEETAGNGEFGIVLAQDSMGNMNTLDATFRSVDPTGGYLSIAPPAAEGVNQADIKTGSYSAVGWNWTVITQSCKNPEQAYMLLDWMTSDYGYMTCFYGPEGSYWDDDVFIEYKGERLYTLNDAYQDTKANNPELFGEQKINNFNWIANGVYGALVSDYDWSLATPSEGERFEGDVAKISRGYAMNSDELLNTTPNTNTDEGIILASFETMFAQANTQVILAESEDEAKAIIAQTLEDAETINYDAVLSYMTEIWNANKAKMGK